MPVNTQFGVKKESQWNSAVTVDQFFEISSESITLETGRSESEGIRKGARVPSIARFSPYVLGATGSVELDVLTNGFGFWLEHMLGKVTTGNQDAGTTLYPHTATLDSLCGKSFTAQVNRPFAPCGDTNQAFTWSGGKVASWTLECEKEGLVKFSAELVFGDEKTNTALATASFPANAETIGWAGSTVKLGGSQVPVEKWAIECNNALKTDRYQINGTSRRAEPVEEGLREITVTVDLEFTSLTHYNKIAAELPGDTLGAFWAEARGATEVGTGGHPGLEITIPNVRWDEGPVNTSGQEILTQSISGRVLTDNSAQPIEILYESTDATV